VWNEYEDVPEPAVPRYKSLCDSGDADYRYRYCTPTQTDTERTCLAVGPTQFTPPLQTRQHSPVRVVSGVAV